MKNNCIYLSRERFREKRVDRKIEDKTKEMKWKSDPLEKKKIGGYMILLYWRGQMEVEMYSCKSLW